MGQRRKKPTEAVLPIGTEVLAILVSLDIELGSDDMDLLTRWLEHREQLAVARFVRQIMRDAAKKDARDYVALFSRRNEPKVANS